jgi:methyl-accepting chemotaxis protein
MPRLQGRFVAWLVAGSALVATTVAWAVLLAVWSPLGSRLVWSGMESGADGLFMDASMRVLATTLTLVVIFGLVALVAGVLFSHRIAGPLHRIGMAAEEVAEGHFTVRVALRRGDYLHGFAEQFNDMLDCMERRFRAQQKAITQAQCRLTDLEIALSDERMDAPRMEEALQAALRELREARLAELTEATPYT